MDLWREGNVMLNMFIPGGPHCAGLILSKKEKNEKKKEKRGGKRKKRGKEEKREVFAFLTEVPASDPVEIVLGESD